MQVFLFSPFLSLSRSYDNETNKLSDIISNEGQYLGQDFAGQIATSVDGPLCSLLTGTELVSCAPKGLNLLSSFS